MDKIKSLVLLELGKLELKQVKTPQYGCNEVLIKVASASICHTDFVVMEGQHSWAKYPCVLGHEFSGTVLEVGSGVSDLKKGQKVTAMGHSYCGKCRYCINGNENTCKKIKVIPFHLDGAYQEIISVPSNMVFPIKESLSMDEAALVEPAANSYATVDRANINPRDKVVIIGPGSIGLLATQFARLKQPGLLIVNGTRKERLCLAEKFGATHTINVRKVDPYKATIAITGKDGADVVIFCGGGLDAWQLAESILAPCGRIVVEATPETTDTRWPVTVSKFHESAISFIGVSGYNVRQFTTALKLIENSIIDVSSLITHRFSLGEYKEAFKTSKERRQGAIKVVFNIGC